MAGRGHAGVGQVQVTSFSIPESSVNYWEQRLLSTGTPVERSGRRFDEEVLQLADPDGLRLELIAHPHTQRGFRPWVDASVPVEHAIGGFYSVTLCEQGYEATARLLETMGFRKIGEEGNRFRFDVGEGGAGARVDVLCASEASYGRIAVGTVHHVAWRVADDSSQLSWRKRLVAEDLNVTPVIDRCYFHSIYFREPGGVLFELATDPPGFTTDEPEDRLGEALKLPPWLESSRKKIERVLPPIELHKPVKGAHA
jgi:glyoxalase family protein